MLGIYQANKGVSDEDTTFYRIIIDNVGKKVTLTQSAQSHYVLYWSNISLQNILKVNM